jgi:hypothetical protein
MPLNLASPGVIVREVDLTIGGINPSSSLVGAIAGPFVRGPVDTPITINNEQDLIRVFGTPYSTDKQYETWLTASSFLSYGGSLRVIRSSDSAMKNGKVGAAASILIKSNDDYVNKGYHENTITDITFAAKNPGSWSNGLKIAIIDAKSDQILSGINTTDINVGYGVTQSVFGRVEAGAGTTSILGGYLRGIVTGIGTDTIEVKVLSHVAAGSTAETIRDYQPSGVYAFSSNGSVTVHENNGDVVGTLSYTAASDWYNQQIISLKSPNTFLYWKNLAPRPGTTSYAESRSSR